MTIPVGTFEVPRVLHVVGAMNVGGAETMLMNLYRNVDRTRVQFDFLVYGEESATYDDEIVELGGRIFHLPHPRERGVRAATSDVRGVLTMYGPFRAVHAHILHASSIALRASASEAVPVRIAHSHSTGDVAGGLLRDVYVRWARRSIRAHATELVACGAAAGAYLFGKNARWVLLRNGVDLDRFRPADADTRQAARESLGVPDGHLALGAVARFEPVKNHEHLVVVARELVDSGVPFRMLLAGDGSRRAASEATVRELGISEHVTFLGLREDIPGLLAALDGLLMPSRFEGIPVALVEAQAAGVPCLVSDAVSREVDLDIGLVDFLPIDSLEPWVAAVSELRGRRCDPDAVFEGVRAAGADVREGVDLLYRLYELDGQP